MISIGSVARNEAAERFDFLRERFPGRRAAIKELTHTYPEFVFWIFPDGRLFNARDSHRQNTPRNFEWILEDEPDYGGFLRGRVARYAGNQLVVVYCREDALATPGPTVRHFVQGISGVPVYLEDDTLVISDNGDLYGTIADLKHRAAQF